MSQQQQENLKKVIREVSPFAAVEGSQGLCTIVCTGCFRFLAFPSGAKAIRCGACEAKMSHVQAKCAGCTKTLRIPLSTREFGCPSCKHTMTALPKMRVTVDAEAVNQIPPPINITVKIDKDVDKYTEKYSFDARIQIGKPLSSNTSSWEITSGSKFRKVKYVNESNNNAPLAGSKTPIELKLKDGDVIRIKASDGGGKSSLSHEFTDSTFSSPTYCGICSKFIYGVYNQGRTCAACNLSVHHKCAEACSTMCDSKNRQQFGLIDFEDFDEDGGDGEVVLQATVIEDPQAFLAACKPDLPVECSAEKMASISKLGDLSDEEIAALWTKYDADKSGTLERKEAHRFFVDVLGASGVKSDEGDLVGRLISRMDSDSSGTVDWEEFYTFLAAQRDSNMLAEFAGVDELSTEQIYKIWGEVDRDGSGFLEPDEVCDLLAQLTKTAPKKTGGNKKLKSFIKEGQKVSWETFYETIVPILNSAVKK